jgi:hypothetical protein
MPGTLANTAYGQNGGLHPDIPCCRLERTYGSAIRRSVSFTILFGKAAIPAEIIRELFCY